MHGMRVEILNLLEKLVEMNRSDFSLNMNYWQMGCLAILYIGIFFAMLMFAFFYEYCGAFFYIYLSIYFYHIVVCCSLSFNFPFFVRVLSSSNYRKIQCFVVVILFDHTGAFLKLPKDQIITLVLFCLFILVVV